jgi:hypothetical protein
MGRLRDALDLISFFFALPLIFLLFILSEKRDIKRAFCYDEVSE